MNFWVLSCVMLNLNNYVAYSLAVKCYDPVMSNGHVRADTLLTGEI